jgi:hypothetical protein
MTECFEWKRYVIRIMQQKGYMAKKLPNGAYVDVDADVMEIFRLQEPSWKSLIERHNLAADRERAEHLLTTFGHREVVGGVGKILETFSKHLEAQPKQGGSPDWSKAGREWRECVWCDGRGVVSNIPVLVERRDEVVERTYSFACKCDNGRRVAGIRVADDWMIQYAADRKTAEIHAHEAKLKRYGIDPKADGATRARQFRRAIGGMLEAVASGKVTAKLVQPILPKTVEEARSILADRRRRTSPPEKLNPERVALAVYGNGDERNEWE